MNDSTPRRPPAFSVVPGAAVHRALAPRCAEILDVVEQAYRLHGLARTVNPPSYFLRFPDRPTARIIALPASLGGEHAVDGIKWISSFPTNLDLGLPRASAMLVLNDPVTGYPYACLESSIISAVRTAASAALAARVLTANRQRPRRIGFVGCGLIARYLHTYLAALGWDVDAYGVYDLSAEYAESFARQVLAPAADGHDPVVHPSVESLIKSSDLVVFATTAATPHVLETSWFDHNPVVLHVSLRDLGPDVIQSAVNIVDDIEHVLKADTSVHLTEQLRGDRDFIDGTLYDALTGVLEVPEGRTAIFSPFGLGVLDLAVGGFAYRHAAEAGTAVGIPGFFHDLDRHQRAE